VLARREHEGSTAGYDSCCDVWAKMSGTCTPWGPPPPPAFVS
jgi:hypothetical protein